MAEIKVTYETLFDLLRREKGRNELQGLEMSFYEDVSSYLQEKNNSLSISSSRGEQEKIKIQIKNVKKILKELYELREKKIINLAFSKVRTNSNLIDTSKLLEKEKHFFEEACELFFKYKSEILEGIISEQDSQRDPVPREEPKPEEKEEPVSEDIKVKILNDLPRFLGVDKKIYGPFNKGDLAVIPLSTAELLLDKNRAERV